MSDTIDLLQLHCAGARLNPEPSRAMPLHRYSDPAAHVKFAGETGCSKCLYYRNCDARCGKGKRQYKRCEFFRIAKK